jgi:Predicted pPIWI-associating nuclease
MHVGKMCEFGDHEMTEKDEKKPEWEKASREDIEEARKNWEGIRSKGETYISRGLIITDVAKRHLGEIGYANRLLNTDFPKFVLTDSVVSATGASFLEAANSLADSSKEAFGLLDSIDRESEPIFTRFRFLADSTSVTSGSIVYLGAEIEKRIETLNPSFRPVYQTAKPDLMSSRRQILDNLRDFIRNYNQKYLNMLDGSEDALMRQGIDNLSQAAHSMRDLFQQIIEHLAPAEAVRMQPWFIPTPEAPEGVSRRSRIKYLLHGSGESYDDDTIGRLDQDAGHAKTALDLAISRAHSHDPSLTVEEVTLSIDHARYWLLEIVKRYIKRT